MKKGTIALIVIGVLVLIAIFSTVGKYNSLQRMRESVKSQWANVENQYQRRADLIPNLVNTVKGYASHESSTLEAVTDARARATQMQVNFEDLNDQTIANYNAAQGQLSSALGRLMAIAESYPDLKANQNFRDLQVQLEGTENRISTERKRFNDEARDYNTTIRQFPNNIIAGLFGFESIPYFAAEPGAATAPVVNFD
ncbi:MAG: LemA family protein [Rikenellaceae bacterium]|nr:LemA family protein [Rikenellaceae bacterium]